jgi:hypothetical protein
MHSEVLVITIRDDEFSQAMARLRPDQIVLDFARVIPSKDGLDGEQYDGICW